MTTFTDATDARVERNRLAAHGEAIDEQAMIHLLKAENHVYRVGGLGSIMDIARNDENHELNIPRMYGEGLSIIALAAPLLDALEEAARRWPWTIDWLLYGIWTDDDAGRKARAWKSAYDVVGGTLTVKEVTLSGDVKAWQAEATLRELIAWTRLLVRGRP